MGVNAVASLMSYSIFGDSLPVQRLQLLRAQEHHPGGRARRADRGGRKGAASGGAQVRTPKWTRTRTGTATRWRATRVPRRWDAPTGASGFMTRQGRHEHRGQGRQHGLHRVPRGPRSPTCHRSIPITDIAREDIEYLERARRGWSGRSQNAEPVVNTHSIGRAELVGYGQDYMGAGDHRAEASHATRAGYRSRADRPQAARAKKSAPATKTTTTKKPG